MPSASAQTPPGKLKLGRARTRLRKLLAGGWTRAVFSTPKTPEGHSEETVIEGPGSGPLDESTFAAVMEAAEDAARRGRVKLVFVLDPRRSVEVDARHGHARLRIRDDASLLKAMGGKERVLRPDASAELLRAIGIMNADGSISAKNAKKYKQVNHLVELCRPSWEAAQRTVGEDAPLRILDLGCGNSTLGFVLAEALRLRDVPARLHGVDRREDLIVRCRDRAATLGWDHMSFSVGEIGEGETASRSSLEGPADLVLALHACDTATDEALALAIAAETPSIFCVPCCQAEVARQLATPPARSASPVSALVEHGLLRRAYADALTDAIRVELLESCGYAVQVVEFVGSEHTAKNVLLRAQFEARGGRTGSWDLAPVRERCRALAIEPDLLRRLLALDEARERSG